MTTQNLDWNSSAISKLIVSLQEMTREEGKTEKPLYKFVDFDFIDSLLAFRNHVIFGRRGSGKSALLRELQLRCQDSDSNILTVLIDVEQISQKSIPNFIITMLITIFEDLRGHLKKRLNPFQILDRKRLISKLNQAIDELEYLLKQADSGELITEVSKGNENERQTDGGAGIAIKNILDMAVNTGRTVTIKRGEKTIKTETWQKMNELNKNTDKYRSLIEGSLPLIGRDTLYILIDDFYQINLYHQPLVADYLKRISRRIPCYLKIATVRNRSLLFVKDLNREAGLQIEQDYTSIDLDLSLDNLDRTKNFLGAIFRNAAADNLGQGPLRPEALFAKHALDSLIEGSGGNPRDFINLLIKVMESKRILREYDPVNRSNVEQAVREYHKKIKDETEMSFYNAREINDLLNKIKDFCRYNDDIGFYISNSDIKTYPALYSLVGQLMDSRFIHLLSSTYETSIPREFPASAYILAMGVYIDVFKQHKSFILGKRNNKPFPRLPLDSVHKELPDLSPELEVMSHSYVSS